MIFEWEISKEKHAGKTLEMTLNVEFLSSLCYSSLLYGLFFFSPHDTQSCQLLHFICPQLQQEVQKGGSFLRVLHPQICMISIIG